MTIGGREKCAQFVPVIGENALLELLEDAIEQDFFSEGFLHGLRGVLKEKLRLS